MANYEMIRKLGEGGMGVVYEARHIHLDRRVAIKFLTQSEGLPLARFQREMTSLGRISHPNIVKILDHGQQGEQLYFVMELLHQRTLYDLIREKAPLPVGQTLKILEQLLDALGYCHREGLIHRDVKPGNIAVSEEDHLTLMDFGLVKEMDRTVLTQVGKIMGTPAYMAPEMLRGETVGTAADVWSAGILLYNMLTKKHPFHHDEIPEMARRIVYDPVPNIAPWRPDVERPVLDFLYRCLDKEPGTRYLDGGEALEALKSLGKPGKLRPSRKSSAAKDKDAKDPREPRSGRQPREGTAPAIGDSGPRPRRETRKRLLGGRLRYRTAFFGGAAALGVIFLTVIVLWAGRSRETPISLVPLPGQIEITWESSSPYRGRVQLYPLPSPGAPPAPRREIALEEAEATTRHRFLTGNLAWEQDYQITVSDASGRELAVSRARPASPALLGTEMQRVVKEFDPVRFQRTVHDEIPRLSAEQIRATTARRELIERWRTRFVDRYQQFDLERLLTSFASSVDTYFSSRDIPAVEKSLTAGSLHQLELVLAHLKSQGVTIDQVQIPQSSWFGLDPKAGRFPANILYVPVARTHGLTPLHSADRLRVLPAPPIDKLVLIDHTRSSADKLLQIRFADSSPVPRHELPEPISLPPAEEIEELHVTVVARKLDPFRSLILQIEEAPGAWRTVAYFRDMPELEPVRWHRTDPRLFPDRPFRVALQLISPSPMWDSFVEAYGIAFRYRRTGTGSREPGAGGPGPPIGGSP